MNENKRAPTRVDGLHKAFIGGLNQLLRSFIHLSNIEGFIKVTMETVVVDGDVHCVSEKEGGRYVSAIMLHDRMDSIMFPTHKETSVMNKHLS